MICAGMIKKLNQLQQEIGNYTTTGNLKPSNADEILKFKKLLDKGIITQEET